MMNSFKLLELIVAFVAIAVAITSAQKPATSTIIPGDGIDNDGDGLIDEEYCYNGIDEDDDGLLNEDCAYLDICPRHGSSTGREFVAMFLDNQPDESALNPLYMFVGRTSGSSPDVSFGANITTPLLLLTVANDGTPIPATTNVKASIPGGQIGKLIQLPYQLRVTDVASAKKSLHIRTDTTAAVHGFNIERYTADSFLNLPANSLGRDYFAATYVPSLLNTEVAIVGLYTNTTVNISLMADLGEPYTPRLLIFLNGVYYENGQSLLVKLQPFEVLIITSEYDMTGLRATASLPVAFFSGNLRTWVRNDATEGYVQSRDHLVEQIPPVETWGKRFVTYNYPPHMMTDVVRVMASQPNTDVVVRISNSSGDFRINFSLKRPGMYREFSLGKRERLSAVASLPVMVVHYTHSQLDDHVPPAQFTDPSLIYVTPVDQYDTEYVFGTAEYVGTPGYQFVNYVMLSARKGTESSIMLDGQPIDGVNWQEVSLSGGQDDDASSSVTYVQGYATIAAGVHRLSSSNPFGAIQWSVSDRESIAHSLGIRFNKDKCEKCMQVICGDHVDNDCDGRIDEETCDGQDNDGDGLTDEDCSCRGGKRQIFIPTTSTAATTPQPTRRPTTTTPEPAKQVKIPTTPPGLCSSGRARGDCSSINVVFIVDVAMSRLDESGDRQGVFNGLTGFLKDAVNSWLPDSGSKFGVLFMVNGIPSFNQQLTDQRSTVVTAINRRLKIDLIPDAESTDLALSLRMVRTDFFPSADAAARKVVIVLAFAAYADRSIVGEIRNETSMLQRTFGADVYFIAQTSHREQVARLAASPAVVFSSASFNSWSQFSSPDQGVVLPVILASCGSSFQSAKICYNQAQTLTCPSGSALSILSANFGRIGYLGETSCGAANPLNCEADDVACPYVDAYYPVAFACNGLDSCQVIANSSFITAQSGPFPTSCKLGAVYLDVNYICADTNGGSLPPCSFTPATRMLALQHDMTISASSYASCLSCGNSNPDQQTSSVCRSDARSQCLPTMSTFDSSSVEAWCPSIDGTAGAWIQADLGAPYVILGVLIQGRRRITTQYVSEVTVLVSGDNKGFTRVTSTTATRRQTFIANGNSSDVAFISFGGNTQTVARYVRLQVEKFADHPALHFEVIINNRVRGCEAFRATGTSQTGKRGALGDQQRVTCTNGGRTASGESSYQTVCQDNGKWSLEVTCQS